MCIIFLVALNEKRHIQITQVMGIYCEDVVRNSREEEIYFMGVTYKILQRRDINIFPAFGTQSYTKPEATALGSVSSFQTEPKLVGRAGSSDLAEVWHLCIKIFSAGG